MYRVVFPNDSILVFDVWRTALLEELLGAVRYLSDCWQVYVGLLRESSCVVRCVERQSLGCVGGDAPTVPRTTCRNAGPSSISGRRQDRGAFCRDPKMRLPAELSGSWGSISAHALRQEWSGSLRPFRNIDGAASRDARGHAHLVDPQDIAATNLFLGMHDHG